MSKARIIFSIIIFFLGVFLSISQVLHQNYISALLFLVLSVIVTAIVLLGFFAAYEMPFFKEVAGSIILILGVWSVFFESPGFDVERQKAHIDALNSFTKLELRQCPTNNELYSLQKEGIKACALQNNEDQLQAVFDLQKARALGPGLSLLDSLRAEIVEFNKDWCAEIFKVTYKICPEAFLTMTKDSKTILEKGL